MIYYNETYHVQEDILEEWIQWMVKTHLPNILRTGYFTQGRLLRIKSEQDQGGYSFAVQLVASSQSILEEYKSKEERQFQQTHLQKYADKALIFRTELQLVCEYHISDGTSKS